MFFRIQITPNGWIVEGGNFRSDGDFIAAYTDVATDEDQIGPIMNQFNHDEVALEKEKHRKEDVKRIAAKLEKKTTKKKVVKKKITRKSAATNDKPNMATGDGLG